MAHSSTNSSLPAMATTTTTESDQGVQPGRAAGSVRISEDRMSEFMTRINDNYYNQPPMPQFVDFKNPNNLDIKPRRLIPIPEPVVLTSVRQSMSHLDHPRLRSQVSTFWRNVDSKYHRVRRIRINEQVTLFGDMCECNVFKTTIDFRHPDYDVIVPNVTFPKETNELFSIENVANHQIFLCLDIEAFLFMALSFIDSVVVYNHIVFSNKKYEEVLPKEVYLNNQKYKHLSHDTTTSSGRGVFDLADMLLLRYNCAKAFYESNMMEKPVINPCFYAGDLIPNGILKMGYWSEFVYKYIYGNQEHTLMNELKPIRNAHIATDEEVDEFLKTCEDGENWRFMGARNISEHDSQMRASRKGEKITPRKPRSVRRKDQEEVDVNRQLPVIKQNDIERPPDNGSNDKYDKKVQYGPWFLKEPECTNKQLIRLKKLFPYLLHGEFDLKLMSKAFFQFNLFLFQQQYFRDFKNDKEARKNAILAFQNVIEGKSLVRLEEKLKPCFTVRYQTVYVWLNDFRLFMKVFCGTRESQIADVWELARKESPNKKFDRPKHEAQGMFDLGWFKGFMPSYANFFGGIAWGAVKSSIKDIPSMIGTALGAAVAMSLENLAKATAFMKEKLDLAIKTIKDFLVSLFPPHVVASCLKLGLVLTVMAMLILLLILVPLKFERTAMSLIGLALGGTAVALGFVVQDNFMNHLLIEAEEHESQSWDTVWKVVMMIGGLFSLRNISSLFSIGRNIKPVFADMKEFLKKAWDWIYKGVTGDHFWPEFDDVKNLKIFMEQVKDLFGEIGYVQNYKVVKSYALRTVHLSKQIWHFKNVIKNMKLDASALRYYTDVMQCLENKASDITNSSAFFRDRYEPVCVTLRGKPNQGKSKVSEFLPEAIYAHCRAQLPSEFPLEWSSEMIFSPSRDKFCDGLSVYSQCWKEDDFLQSRDKQLRAEEALRFIQLISPSRMSVASAALEGKGNTFVTTPLVLMTTNFDMNNPVKIAECNVEEPNAMRRRFHVVLEVERIADFDDPVANRNHAWNFKLEYFRDKTHPLFEGQEAAQKSWPDDLQEEFAQSTASYKNMNFKEVCEMVSSMICSRAQKFRNEHAANYDWLEPPTMMNIKHCPSEIRRHDTWIRMAYHYFTKDKSTVNLLHLLQGVTFKVAADYRNDKCYKYMMALVVYLLTKCVGMPLENAQRLFITWWDKIVDQKDFVPPADPPSDFHKPPPGGNDFQHIMEVFSNFKNRSWDDYEIREGIERKAKGGIGEDDVSGMSQELFHDSQAHQDYIRSFTRDKEGLDYVASWISGTWHYLFNDSPINVGETDHLMPEDFKERWMHWTPFDTSQRLENYKDYRNLIDPDDWDLLDPDYTKRKAYYNRQILKLVNHYKGLYVEYHATQSQHPFTLAVNQLYRYTNPVEACAWMCVSMKLPYGTAPGAEVPYWLSKLFKAICELPAPMDDWKALWAHPEALEAFQEFMLQADPATLVPVKANKVIEFLNKAMTGTTIYVLSTCWSIAVLGLIAVLSWYFSQDKYKDFESQSISREKMARLAERKPLKLQFKTKSGRTKKVELTKEQIEKDDKAFHQAQSGIGDQISSKINKLAANMRILKFFKQVGDEMMEIETNVIFSGRRSFPVKHVFFAKGTTWDIVEIWNGDTLVSRFDAGLVKITMSTADGRDLAYVDFPKDFPQFPTLKNKFIFPGSIKDMDRYSFFRLSRQSAKGSPQILVYETGHIKRGNVSTSRLLDPNGVEMKFKCTDFWISVNGLGISGDCGNVLIAADLTTGDVWIMGVHIGRAGDDTYFVNLTNDDLLNEEAFHVSQNGPTIMRNGVHIPSYLDPKLQYRQNFDGRMVAMGTVKPSFIPTETNLIPTVFQGNTDKEPIFPISTAPAKLKPFILEEWKDEEEKELLDSELIRPLEKAVKKMVSAPARTFPRWLRRLFEKYPQRTFAGFLPRERKNFRFLTLEEALSKLDMSTSVGYDMQCHGFTSRSQLWRKDGDKVIWVHPKLKELVMELWNAMRAGKSLKNVVSGCLKDELRDLERVNQGKTRLFCVGSLCHLIVTVMVMGDIVSFMKTKRAQTDVYIGVNPHGWEWTALNRKMRRWGSNAKYGGGDYSNYDSSILSGFGFGLYLCMKYYTQWTDPWMLFALESVCVSALAPIMVISREAYWLDWMNTSGGWLTGFLNSFVGVVLFNAYVEHYNAKNGTNFTREEVLVIAIYGDDNVWACHNDFKEHFDMYKFSAFVFDHFGMTYTTPDKGDITEPYLNYDTLNFLCRALSTKDVIHPKLSLDSITGMLLWIRSPKRGVSVTEQLCINIEQAAMEWFHYGKEDFEKYTSRVREYCEYYSVPYTGRSYEEYRDRWHEAMTQ